MGSYKYLLKNIGLLTLGSFTTKLLSFFLVPLYTNVLTTTEYGTYDLFNTTISVLIPILTFNIQEATLRFALDKKQNKEAIVSVSVKYTVISIVLVAGLLAINSLFQINDIIGKFSVVFLLMFITQVISGIVTMYIRGIDKIADLSFSSVIASIVTISCNILFLVVFKWGLIGYFVANFIGPFIQCIYLIVKNRILKYFRWHSYKIEEKEMLNYSKPLIANSIAWWINNVSDRYVIVFFCGLAENGIYSVAGKIPSILNVFQSIFNSAWTLSAVKDYDPEDKSGFFSNTYKAYNCMMTIVCSGIILFNKVLAHFLYSKDFYIAWKYVPWLTIAILFGALSGYIGGFFSAVKDSKIFAISTIVGAIINVILNLVFTPIYGAMGAAVATAVCYFVVWIYRLIQSKKYIKLRINIIRDLLSYILLVVMSIIIIYGNEIKMYIYSGSLFLLIIIFYARDIKSCMYRILKR